MNENEHTIRLWNFLTGREGWGRAAGAVAQRKLAAYIDAHRDISVFRIAMDSVKKIDVGFASEALIGLVGRYLGTTSICLVNLADEDILENIAAAAERTKVSVTIWNRQHVQVVGPALGPGRHDALSYALARSQVRTGEFAEAAGLSAMGASNRFRQLWEMGILARRERSAPSGGSEFVYSRIG